MHRLKILYAGKKLSEAEKALVMVHGRGGTAEDILSLSGHLHVKPFALVAPQATNHSWYPHSFLAKAEDNEPWLSSALQILTDTVSEIEHTGINKEDIYFTGFSQGACLALEFVARNATRYGGLAAFTGGLIGDKIYTERYKGDFAQSRIFIGTSDPDPHVPVERVHASTNILKQMNAAVTEKVYTNMGHIIQQAELDMVNALLFDKP